MNELRNGDSLTEVYIINTRGQYFISRLKFKGASKVAIKEKNLRELMGLNFSDLRKKETQDRIAQILNII